MQPTDQNFSPINELTQQEQFRSKINRQNLRQISSPQTQKSQKISTNNNKVHSHGYSSILKSFNRRLTDLYSTGEESTAKMSGSEDQFKKFSQKCEPSKTVCKNDVYENAPTSSHLSPILEGIQSTINSFKLEVGEQAPAQTGMNPLRQCSTDELFGTGIQAVSYQGICHMDPQLLQTGSKIDQQQKKFKQALMQKTFVKRYAQLIKCQKDFEFYKLEKNAQISELRKRINELFIQNQQFEGRIQQLKEEIERTQIEHTSEINRLNSSNHAQREECHKKILQLGDMIATKNHEISRLQNDTIARLQSQLDEQMKQNLHLAASIQAHLTEITNKDQQLSTVDSTYRDLIGTLQESLASCENEKNALSQDFQRVCEQLHVLNQVHTTAKHQLRHLESQNLLRTNQLQAVREQILVFRESHQKQIYQHQIKYLQEIKEKNAIIQMLEETKENQKTVSSQLEENRQKVVRLERQLMDRERQIKTERIMYVETCGQYQKEISHMKQELEAKERQLSSLQLRLGEITNEQQEALVLLTQQINTLQKNLEHKTQLCTCLQAECIQLRQLKSSSVDSLSRAKASFYSITQQLKNQLSKAKQIIKSKNDQINETRRLNYSLQENLRAVRTESCRLENQLADLIEQSKAESFSRQEQYQKLALQLQELKTDKLKQVGQRDETISSMQQKIKQNQTALKDQSLRITSLQLRVQTFERKIQQSQILIKQLTTQLKISPAQLQRQEYCSQSQLASVKEVGQEQKQEKIGQVSTSSDYKELQQSILGQQQVESQTVGSDLEQRISFQVDESSSVEEQLITSRKQLSKTAELIVEIRTYIQQVSKLNQLLMTKIMQSKSYQDQQNYESKLHQKYPSVDQLIFLGLLLQKPPFLQAHHYLNNEENQTTLTPSSNHVHPQRQFQNQYVRPIRSINFQISELILYFKSKSAQQQSHRILLQNQNQQLTLSLFQLISKPLLIKQPQIIAQKMP